MSLNYYVSMYICIKLNPAAPRRRATDRRRSLRDAAHIYIYIYIYRERERELMYLN